ncbi:hypothetical protein QS460_04385 [Liquorilactobacillus mali]|uniref:hypothetical protein n=1 Tax=Liquorilactobacillus mali TaxID=1618 RepID=UPI002653C99F|nr:hypothetical protein [Liquorilactobacillus mali]MDN7145163.1 hypothetical protein [Liquorilactobacillus mali]
MMNDIFDKELETSELRGNHIAESIDEIKLNEQIREHLTGDTRFSDTLLSTHLDNLADYFLESEDVRSNRKIDQSFFKTEREYAKYKQSKTALIGEENTLDWLCNGAERGVLSDEYVAKLISNMSGKNVMRWIKGLNKHVHDMPRVMVVALMDVIDASEEVGSKGEKKVFKKILNNMSIEEIAKERNVGVRNIQKQFKNLCNKIAERVRNNRV